MPASINNMAQGDALLQDQYGAGKRPAKKKSAKGRDFRGMKNGVKDSGPGPVKKKGKKNKKGKPVAKKPSALIQKAMTPPNGAPC